MTERNAAWLKTPSYFQDKDIDRLFLVEPFTRSTENSSNDSVPNSLLRLKGSHHVMVPSAHRAASGASCTRIRCAQAPAQTLTFCELLILEPDAFYFVLSGFPREKRLVRRATVRLAVRRGILMEARRRQQASNAHVL